MSELIRARMELLVEFDKYIMTQIGDEDIIDYWLMWGLEDGYDEVTLEEYASDDELWLEMISIFKICCASAK